MYISHAPFGGNVVGLDAAAWRYFGHPAEELSWAEAAMLAVLPNAPAMIHLSKSRQLLLNKRNRLLKQLYARKIIDNSTYELAISATTPRRASSTPPNRSPSSQSLLSGTKRKIFHINHRQGYSNPNRERSRTLEQ